MADVSKYVQGKRNSYTTRTARLLWVQDKIRTYTQEEEDLKRELAKEVKNIEELEALVETLAEKNLAMEEAQKRLANIAAEDVPAALDGILNARAEIDEVEAQIRAKYYAK